MFKVSKMPSHPTIVYLISVALDSLGDGDEAAVNVSVENGLVPVSAGEGELGNEGDGSQDLTVCWSVGGGGHLGLSTSTQGGPCEHQDTNYGQHCGSGLVICNVEI